MYSTRDTNAPRILGSLLLLVTAGLAVAADPIWVEAEHFAEHGGWKLDAQFIDQMGSPYLLADGLGTPVEDARTTIDVAQAGKYRLWVRTKDWLPEYHPGPFRIVLGGREVEKTFGIGGRPGWLWEDGGIHELAGSVTISLHDLAGFYGRCDALVLSSDLEWVPPEQITALAELRREHGGLSAEVEEMPAQDVVVVGGGLAGCTAAVAAARGGASVVLIQNRPMLGGNASPEILVPPVGVWPHGKNGTGPLDPRETGIIEEYRTRGNQRVSEGKLYAKRLMRFVQLEPNLDLFLNTHAMGVEMTHDTDAVRQGNGASRREKLRAAPETSGVREIGAVLAMDVQSGRRMRFPGRLFIDCTGDAVVGVAAGAEYRHGKEAKSMYNEPWAPDEPNSNTMGNSIKYYCRDVGEPQSFTAPPWAYEFPTCESIGPMRHPRLGDAIDWQWMIELGGLRDTYADAEAIRDDLFRLAYGLVDHVKNHCTQHADRAPNQKLLWVGYVAGKRESRRLIGDYVLTQNDVDRQTIFPDSVAYGGWSIDDHYSGGFFHRGPPGQHHDHPEMHLQGVRFSIPFRTLYSKNVANLMMAGRDHSASHLGMSDTRVMLTCAVMGHAVGTAAGICVAENATPRTVCYKYIERLQQQLLKEGAYLIGFEADDPRDLAPKAQISVSSERRLDNGQTMTARNVVNGVARAVDDETNAWSAEDSDESPRMELIWPEPVKLNMVHVVFQTQWLAPARFSVDAWLDGSWKSVAALDDNRLRRLVFGLDRITTPRLRITLEQPAGICEIRVYDEPEREVAIARRALENMRLPDRGPWLPWDEVDLNKKYGGIVIDGWDAQQIGAWIDSSYTGPYVGDGYLHDGNRDKGEKSLRFSIRPPSAGRYEVRLAYVAYMNRASNTPVTVRHADGEKTVQIDQRKKPPIEEMFFSIGTFELDENSLLTVSNAGTDGYVVADAVQLVPTDNQALFQD